MKYSVLSVPGLPNGLMALSSRSYHDPYPFVDLIESLNGKDFVFHQLIWPKEVAFPLGNFCRFVPFFGMFLFYWVYQFSSVYREELLFVLKERLNAAFDDSDIVYVIAHSHGNRLILDLLQSFELPAGKKLVWLGQAPAFSGVCFGLKSDDVSLSQLELACEKCFQVEFVRIKGDLLSGKPLNSNCREFDSRFWEFLFLSHSSVRSRKDILSFVGGKLKKP